MTTTACQIRRMNRSDLNTALCWAAREGWNPGLHDASPFRVIDPKGFFMGWLDERPVASISALRYSPSYGFLGFYIVEPSQRGRGFGRAIWSAAMAHLTGCVVGLDGVVEQQASYARSGFDLAWHNTRFQGPARRGGAWHRQVVALSGIPFVHLSHFDRDFHPEPRHAFLRSWIARTRTHALGWWEGGALRGYGVLRPCSRGYKFGPLCADTPAIAGALFEALSARVPEGEMLAMDVPRANPQALALARQFGLAEGFATARMYRGPAPRLALARQYALTALEIG